MKREESILFIKEDLAKACIKLLSKKPLNNITIKEICNVAGYGRTTYYRYFTNKKEDLLIFIMEKKWRDFKSPHKDLVKDKEGYAILKLMYEYRDFVLLLEQRGLIMLLYYVIDKEVGEEYRDKEVFSYARSMFVGLYFGVVKEWIQRGCFNSPDEIEEKIQEGIQCAIVLSKINQKAQK